MVEAGGGMKERMIGDGEDSQFIRGAASDIVVAYESWHITIVFSNKIFRAVQNRSIVRREHFKSGRPR